MRYNWKEICQIVYEDICRLHTGRYVHYCNEYYDNTIYDYLLEKGVIYHEGLCTLYKHNGKAFKGTSSILSTALNKLEKCKLLTRNRSFRVKRLEAAQVVIKTSDTDIKESYRDYGYEYGSNTGNSKGDAPMVYSLIGFINFSDYWRDL